MPSLPSMTTAPRAIRASTIQDHFRYYRETLPDFGVTGTLRGSKGFFSFGRGVVCYGQSSRGDLSSEVNSTLFDASQHIEHSDHTVLLPFDANEVVNNLRYERYVQGSGWQSWVQDSWVGQTYYFLRPYLPVAVRKHLQRAYLHDWETITFPNLPLDRTADLLMEKLLVVAMQAAGMTRVPFVWFWPQGHQACAILTHDVETTAGRDFSHRLMDLDDEYGIKASFQIVPEKRYTVPDEYLETIRTRGFEVNVQGLDHDGDLFRGREQFLKKARQINEYAAHYRASGFRSPILYRNTDWFQDLNFSYDLSVPNVARLEAQRGGCCTLFPYFLPGGVTELPLTTAEDYTLFHVLNDYSTKLWKQQIDSIYAAHGLMTFIVHPDYVQAERAQSVFTDLLREIATLKSDKNVWVALPKDVDRWWRERSTMTLAPDGSDWRIEGKGSERASVAYACLDGDRLVYEVRK